MGLRFIASSRSLVGAIAVRFFAAMQMSRQPDKIMFHIYPKTRQEWVTTLLRPFWVCLALAFPAYKLLDQVHGGFLMHFVAEALVGFCMLSFAVLLISSLIIVVTSTAHDGVSFRCIWINALFIAVSAVLGWYFTGFIFYH